MPTLKPGQSMQGLMSGLDGHVEELLGEGGQGEVYRVVLERRRYALKWYNERVLRLDRTLRARLQVLIDHGTPSTRFLWPFELVTRPDGSGLGYLMRLRNPSYLKIQALLGSSISPSFRVLCSVGRQLTDAMLALHTKGLVYQDLNAGNVFFDPADGAIEVCDNDNVDIDGAPSVMGGVWEFQAPEVILRRAGPSRATDLHSLAVMLFRILHVGHPLVGRRELDFPNLADESALRRIYGSEARFVFDPDDDSNRPLPDRHGPVLGHWAIYPQFLRALFTRAFGDGLVDPVHGRVQETEWRRALRQLRDAVMTCPHCGAESFYDADRIAARQTRLPCWRCGEAMPSAPPRLGLRRQEARRGDPPAHVIVLERGAQIFPHHLGDAAADPDLPLAEVAGDPPQLRNRCGGTWDVLRDGASAALAPGSAIPIAGGTRIRFGRCEGEIRI